MSKKSVEKIVSGMGVFVSIISLLVERVKTLGGSVESIYRLATPEGRETLEAVAKLIVKGEAKIKNEFFRLISGGQTITIDAVDGSETIVDAVNMFAYIDSDFKNWNLTKKGIATGETTVEVYELVKDGTISQMFSALSSDVRQLCLTQAQINNFVRKHQNWLRKDGYVTFFLFEENNNFFVARVDFYSDGDLSVDVLRFGDPWRSSCRPRVVVKGEAKIKNEFLRLISGGQTITIDAVDGSETIVDAVNIFAYIDSDFKNWNLTKKGIATGETTVEVYELVKDGTFSQMFSALSSDVRQLCLTQAQINNFVCKHLNWLRKDGYATFFLFEENNNFFVADVRFLSVGNLYVNVREFEDPCVWTGVYQHSVVVTQLA